MKTKTGIAVCVISVLAVVLSGIGCQATPDDVYIRPKEGMESIITADDQGNSFSAPSSLEYIESATIFDVDTDIQINATISAPQIAHFPVYSVVPKALTNEQLHAFIAGAFGQNAAFSEVKNNGVTQDMLVRRITSYQTMLSDDRAWELTAKKYPDLIDYYKDAISEKLAQCQTDYGNAPEKINGIQFDAAEELSNVRKLYSDLGGVSPATIEISQDDPMRSYLFFDRGHRMGFALFQANQPHMERFHSENDLTIRITDAKDVADKFLADCGVEGLCCVEQGVDSWFRTDTDVQAFNFKPVYTFVYTPVIMDVGMAYVDINYLREITNWEYRHPEGIMNQVWYQNALHVFVDDHGVQSVTWRNPSAISLLDRITENVQMLPFDAIIEAFIQNIQTSPTFYSSNMREHTTREKPNRQTLYIEKIVLSYACLLSGKGASDYMAIPVWDFYGYVDEEYVNPSDNRRETTLGRSYLTLSAIDGSVIDRIVGY